MRNACKKILVLALVFAGLASFAHRAQAQSTTVQLNFTNQWKYDRSGIQPGTGNLWRTNAPAYDDSAWASGPGLLGFDDGGVGPYLPTVPTGFGVQFPGPLSQTVTTYYFRTTFTLSGGVTPFTSGLQLIATNLMDDGGVIWLNGRMAASIRMPATLNPATLATTGPTDGVTDTVILTNFLRTGVNTLAVEVHQSAATSGDVIWGMKLVTIAPTTLTITNPIDNLQVDVGATATFTVGVSGGPATYRWFKDSTLLPSTSNTLNIVNAQIANSGTYRVVVSNAVNSVESSAVLTVVQDTTGPEVVTAVIDGGNNGTNTILIRFDENVATTATGTGSRNLANYRLVPVANTNQSIQISNILASGAQALLQISTADPNWNSRGSYFLVLNNISDLKGNNIDPYTRVSVSLQVTTNLTQISDNWHFYALNVFDPEGSLIYTDTINPWYGTNYAAKLAQGINDGYWGTGPGILYMDPNNQGQLCAGDSFQTQISFQNFPTLFRRTFNLVGNFPTNAQFRIRSIVDDGMVLYLNGTEIYRYNMPAGPVNENTSASAALNPVVCVTNLVNVSNLRTGSNVLAAAVYQNTTAPESDTLFGLEMDIIYNQTPTMPIIEPPTNQLRLTMTTTRTPGVACPVLRFAWNTNFNGYTLQAKSDLSPLSPWIQVSNQNNPYILSNGCSGYRFFRIAK